MTDDETLNKATGFDGLPIKEYLTYRLLRVQSKLNAQATKILHDSVGLTLSQWRVIALVGAAGTTRLSAMVKETALDKGLLSRNVKTLVEQGLIISRQDEDDHRAQLLSLTQEGQDIFERALPITRSRQAWLRKGLSDADIANFHRILDVIEGATDKTDF